MTEREDAVDTLVRLLDTEINLTYDDGTSAPVLVTRQKCDRHKFKDYAGQIQVAKTIPATVKPLNLEQSVTQYIINLAIQSCAVKNATAEGDRIRQLLREEILRVLRQHRFIPHKTTFDYVNITTATAKHTAFHQTKATQPNPDDVDWTEFTNTEYGKIAVSDDDDINISTSTNTKYPFILLTFKFPTPKETQVSVIVIDAEGFGVIPGGNGFQLSVWNHVTSTWEQTASHTEASDSLLTKTISSGIANYIHEAGGFGYIYVLIQTTQPSDGTLTTVNLDYADSILTVDTITHLRTPTFQDVDEQEGKECFFKTVFSVVGWLIDTVTALE